MANRVERTIAVIDREMPMRYELGMFDCFLMGLRVADAIQDRKIARQYEGVYTSKREINKYMATHRFKSVCDLLRQHYEFKVPAMLQFGDLAVVRRGGDEHVAICCGLHFVSKSENGREVYGLNDVTAGFAV